MAAKGTFQYEEVAKITVASFQCPIGIPAFCTINGPATKKESERNEGEFYYVYPVTNLETGEEQVLNADEYMFKALGPDPSKRSFKIVKTKIAGKRFLATAITEIKVK